MVVRFADVTVTVRGGSSGRSYRVTVTHEPVRYSTMVSAARPLDAAVAVLDHLYLAAYDRNWYVAEMMGAATGPRALAKGKRAERTIRAARRFSYEALADAVDDAKGRGLL